MELKTCGSCKTKQPLENFYANRKTKDKKNSECKSCQHKRQHGTFIGFTERMFRKCKDRHKNKHKEKFDLTLEDIRKLTKPMKCMLTGLDLRTDHTKPRDPFSPSVDRMDNTKGYTKDNIQIVALGINIMKSNYSDDDVNTLAKAWVNRESDG